MELNKYMELALAEAKLSLCEGNNGFGAVIVRDEQIIASAHDTEATDGDPTSHAELNAIRAASKKLGRKLSGCIMLSTHEPCPMCASAVVWSGISEIAYGYSIKEAIKQGRKRIGITCHEFFDRAGADIIIHENILNHKCSILYRKDVRIEIERLRNVNEQILCELNADSINRRVGWFNENHESFDFIDDDILATGYRLLLKRFNTTEEEVPIVERSDRKIVFHSGNFCPTLEACKILGLDTRAICKKLNESSTDTLIKLIDPQLRFSRNYEKLRPYTEYCEEMISIEER